MDNLTLTLAGSEVGTVKIDALESLAKMGVKIALVKLNDQLNEGIVLPRMKWAQLVNSVLKVEQGFIALASDAQVLLTDGGFD
ncbi:bactericidal permeability-increasing protein-like [Lates japonicus]